MYQSDPPLDPKKVLPTMGLWQGFYGESDRVWLRWYDASGNWIVTPEERERRRVERLVEQLR
jgi:hypothetical protein